MTSYGEKDNRKEAIKLNGKWWYFCCSSDEREDEKSKYMKGNFIEWSSWILINNYISAPFATAFLTIEDLISEKKWLIEFYLGKDVLIKDFEKNEDRIYTLNPHKLNLGIKEYYLKERNKLIKL